MPTKKYPLWGIFGYDQACALADTGVRVSFFGIDLRSIRRWRKWGISKGKRDGVNWYVISIPIGKVKKKTLVKIGGVAAKILFKRFLKDKDEPDIIHAHFTNMGAIGAEIKNAFSIPLVITEHSSEMNGDSPAQDTLELAETAYGCADKLLCVSTALSNSIKRQLNMDSEIVPNVIRNIDIYNLEKVKHKGFGYVFTASLKKGKRCMLLLQAFRTVHKLRRDTFLGIIGSGEQDDEINAYIKRHALDDCVIKYGLKSRTEMAEIYRHYDCFVLPSKAETFGVVYIEAMAAGLPVIATRCGGPEDFVNDDNGVLINVDNEDELIKAMIDMYETHDKYDAEVIKRFAIDHFSESVIACKLKEIYRDVISA